MIMPGKLQEVQENASISYAIRRKFTKRSDQGYKWVNTVFYVNHVMKTTWVTSTVSSVSKFIRIMTQKNKISINGLDAIIASDG